MISRAMKTPKLILIFALVILCCSLFKIAIAQPSNNPAAKTAADSNPSTVLTTTVGQETAFPSEAPKPITIGDSSELLEQRLKRKITLDIRDMNMVDVIKFLSVKGEFNVVTSPSVTGRATLLLKSVAIKDALDIVVISNQLAYQIQNDIVQVMSEAEYGALFGKKFSDQTEVKIIHLNYAKPSYVLAALDGIKSNIGKIIIDEDTGSVVLIDTPKSIEEMKKAIESIELPLETYVYNLQYAKADVVAEKLKARIDANTVGSVTADERSNQLIVRAFPARRAEVETLIKSLDQETKEVLVEARVIQIVLKPQYDVGIDWNLDFSDSEDDALKRLTFKNIYLNESNLTTSDELSNIFGKIAIGNVDVNHFSAALRALKQVSDTKILSNPRILVTNNEEAKIHIGDTVPYIISTTSGTGDNAITSEDVRFVDVGLKLNVTPTINDDGYVTMRLKPEISTVVGSIESKGGGIPQVNKTLVETTVMVKDGTSIIMGGLKKDDKSHVKKGFPILMDIPWLSRFFSRTTDTITSTEIVIFITPHIVTGKDDFNKTKGSIKPWVGYNGKQQNIKEDQTLKIKD